MRNFDVRSIEQSLAAGLTGLGIESDPVLCTRLCEYLRLLAQWNRAYNLTAIEDPVDMVACHLLDSLSIAPYLHRQRILDVGTGAGLPGIPLAVRFPEREFHLLDSNGKKMRFLFQVKHTLALNNVVLHQTRAEDFREPQGFDCIVSRALASLRQIVASSAHLLAPGGCFMAMKGRVDDSELAGLPSPYNVAAFIRLEVPGIDSLRQLLRIERDPSFADNMAPV
ncbi:MAG: 16S rRNA (guanine(527)-N(7))-methyltransferase RsmG [Pseudomonadales bacterium]